MRADNDHVFGNSVESCKDESKHLQCPEEKWEDAELKTPENGKINNNVCELFYDTRSRNEWDKENDGNILDRDSDSCGESNEAGKKIRDTSHDSAANGDSLEKVDPVFFMDKNVTVCDLPEIVVCYKENTYHVVKDICVDEGVPVQEKFLFGEKGSVKCSSNSNQCGSEDLMNHLETKSSEESNGKVDDSEISNDHKTDRGIDNDAKGSSSCNLEHLIVTEEVKDLTTQGLKPSKLSLESDSDSDEKPKSEVATSENVIKEPLTLGAILSKEDEQKPLNDINNTSTPEEQSPPQLQEKEKQRLETTGHKTEDPVKTEEKLSSVSTTTSREPETENQQQNYLASAFGETSFSAEEAVSISGHITYSGSIAFSGSLSVRSDASTTSGRSFAFPILQSEWNSSPVKMAKADKRRHKGWRRSLLCCRFS